MKPEYRQGCVHVIKRNGVIIDEGGDEATPQYVDGFVDEIVWFGPTTTMTARGARASDPDVQVYHANQVRRKREAVVEKMKTGDAYREKSIEAREILAGTTYDASKHQFIALEVNAKGITPTEAAQLVVDAITRDKLAQETARVALREKLREQQ